MKIEIPITENDIEAFKELVFNDTLDFTWSFISDTDEQVEVHFTKEKNE